MQTAKNYTVQQYVHAAWCFANNILWSRLRLDEDESRAALGELEFLFTTSKDHEKTFATFCEHAIIGEVLCQALGIIDENKLWKALVHPKGLKTLEMPKISHQQITGIRRTNPIITKAIPIVVAHYIWYLYDPTIAVIRSLNTELDEIEGIDAMNIFYMATQHQPAC